MVFSSDDDEVMEENNLPASATTDGVLNRIFGGAAGNTGDLKQKL